MRDQRLYRRDRLCDVVSLGDEPNGSQRFDDDAGFRIMQAAEQGGKVRGILSAPQHEAAPLAHARSALGDRLLKSTLRIDTEVATTTGGLPRPRQRRRASLPNRHDGHEVRQEEHPTQSLIPNSGFLAILDDGRRYEGRTVPTARRIAWCAVAGCTCMGFARTRSPIEFDAAIGD